MARAGPARGGIRFKFSRPAARCRARSRGQALAAIASIAFVPGCMLNWLHDSTLALGVRAPVRRRIHRHLTRTAGADYRRRHVGGSFCQRSRRFGRGIGDLRGRGSAFARWHRIAAFGSGRLDRRFGGVGVTYREVARGLQTLGCHEVPRAGGGSHRKWRNPNNSRSTAVPDWGGRDFKVGTIRAVVRQLGLDWSSFSRA